MWTANDKVSLVNVLPCTSSRSSSLSSGRSPNLLAASNSWSAFDSDSCLRWLKHSENKLNPTALRGRSQLLTFMKAYTAYARGEGVWDHCMLFPRKSTFIFNHWQLIIKYCTCLECGQYAHICRSFMYNNTFEALFLTSKCTKRGFLWTQTVAPHRGFCKAAQRRYRIFSTWADSSSQNRTKLIIFH